LGEAKRQAQRVTEIIAGIKLSVQGFRGDQDRQRGAGAGGADAVLVDTQGTVVVTSGGVMVGRGADAGLVDVTWYRRRRKRRRRRPSEGSGGQSSNESSEEGNGADAAANGAGGDGAAGGADGDTGSGDEAKGGDSADGTEAAKGGSGGDGKDADSGGDGEDVVERLGGKDDEKEGDEEETQLIVGACRAFYHPSPDDVGWTLGARCAHSALETQYKETFLVGQPVVLASSTDKLATAVRHTGSICVRDVSVAHSHPGETFTLEMGYRECLCVYLRLSPTGDFPGANESGGGSGRGRVNHFVVEHPSHKIQMEAAPNDSTRVRLRTGSFRSEKTSGASGGSGGSGGGTDGEGGGDEGEDGCDMMELVMQDRETRDVVMQSFKEFCSVLDGGPSGGGDGGGGERSEPGKRALSNGKKNAAAAVAAADGDADGGEKDEDGGVPPPPPPPRTHDYGWQTKSEGGKAAATAADAAHEDGVAGTDGVDSDSGARGGGDFKRQQGLMLKLQADLGRYRELSESRATELRIVEQEKREVTGKVEVLRQQFGEFAEAGEEALAVNVELTNANEELRSRLASTTKKMKAAKVAATLNRTHSGKAGAELEVVQAKFEALEKIHGTMEATLKRQAAEQEVAAGSMGKVRDDVRRLENERDRTVRERDTARQDLTKSKELLHSTVVDRDVLRRNLQDRDTEIVRKEDMVLQLREELEDVTQECETAKINAADAINEKLRTALQEKQQLMDQVAQMTALNKVLQVDHDRSAAAVATLTVESNEAKAENDQLRMERMALSRKAASLQKDVAKIAHFDALHKEKEELLVELSCAKAEAYEAKDDLEAYKVRIQTQRHLRRQRQLDTLTHIDFGKLHQDRS
jgi:hypothetical protein